MHCSKKANQTKFYNINYTFAYKCTADIKRHQFKSNTVLIKIINTRFMLKENYFRVNTKLEFYLYQIK